MEKEILGLLENKDLPSLDIYAIKDALKINDIEEIKILQEELDNLVKKGLLYFSNHKKTYTLMRNTHFLQGKLCVNPKGFGFVRIGAGQDDIFIDSSNLSGARNNDVVLIEKLAKNKTEGKIVNIIQRDEKNIVGELFIEDNKYYVKPNKKGNINIFIPDDYLNGAVEGQIVLVKPMLGKEKYIGEIIEKIGFKDDKDVALNTLIYENGFNPVFPENVIEEVKTMPEEVSEAEMSGRLDLRNELIFTIDGSDTKDIDDAISIKRINSDVLELGVHIADVSNYVIPGSEIDKEAFRRSTSVYPGKWVFPMLPPELSNGICSLHQGVDRLTMSCIMQVDKKGKIIKYNIKPSVIRSSKKMTYENVNILYETGNAPEGYESFVEKLLLFKEFKDIGMKKFKERGYLDFNTPETKIIFDEDNKPVEIKASYQKEAEKCIEVAMVYANETTGSHIFYRHLPGIYRVHDKPEEIKLQQTFELLASKGYIVKGNRNKIKVKDLQNVLEQIKDTKEAYVLGTALIQAQSRAIYSNENIGHFGLASTCYSHFTSPIRRYPDLILHRLIKDYDKNYCDEVIDKWQHDLPEICEQVTEREQAADNCERDADKMYIAEYMQDHIGESYQGVISGVQPFGLFVELPNTVEGLIKVEELSGYFTYDQKTQSLYCKNNGKRYSFGDLINIKVLAASKENMTVDFEIDKEQKEYEEKTSKTKKKKAKNR